MLAATRHTAPKGLVAHMALQAGLRWAKHPPSFPVIVMTRNARLAELQLTLSWKTLDRLRTPFDKIWTNEIAAVLEKAGKAVGAAFNASNLGTMQEAIDEAFDVLPFLYNRMYNQVAEVFAVRAGTAARRLMGQEQRADVFDETAESRRWIREQTGSRITQVSANTVKAVKKFVDRTFIEGLTTDQIARGLTDNGIFGRARAFRIACTEVVAASNAGNNFATAAVLPNERFQKVWLSSRDIRVRDTHFSADGQAVDLDAAFKLAGGQLRFPGDSTLGASASEIVNCFVGDTKIDAASDVRAATRYWFDGEVVELILSSGCKLTGTKNHPVLTSAGWIALKDVKQGMDLVCSASAERKLCGQDVKNIPATIAEIFSSFSDSVSVHGMRKRMPVVSVNFHGDRPNSDVDIVWANRFLENGDETNLFKHFSGFNFVVHKIRKFLLTGYSHLDKFFQRTFTIRDILSAFTPLFIFPQFAYDFVGSVSLPFSLFTSHASPFKSFSLRTGTSDDAIISKNSVDDLSRNKKVVGNPIDRVGFVEFDNVVSMDIRVFSGHVYNIETDKGFYSADGSIAHNCRCTTTHKPKKKRG